MNVDEFLNREVVNHPKECGPCEDCQGFIDEHQQGGAIGLGNLVPFYGLRGEVRQMFLPYPAVCPCEGCRPKAKKRGPSVASQVYEMADRGIGALAIADSLGLSDRRVKTLLSKREKMQVTATP